MNRTGTFVHFDLMTTDIKAARAFYTELFGWAIEEMDMGEVTYPLLKVGDQGFGGMVSLEPEAGVPSHWIAYIGVESVDDTCEAVKSLGGAVCVPPTDIPSVGRFAVVNDPQGGLFSPFEGSGDGPAPPVKREGVGEIVWHELMTRERDDAFRFYGEVLGWTRGPSMPMEGDKEAYQMFNSGDATLGAILTMPDEIPRPFWLHYVRVESVDDSLRRAESMGASVGHGPVEVDGVGRFVVLQDPTGAVFALWQQDDEAS